MSSIKQAIIAAGDFWYLQKQLHVLPGVITTVAGYCGGTTSSPSYHNLGDHTPAIYIDFNTHTISYSDILTTVKKLLINRHIEQATFFYLTNYQKVAALQLRNELVDELSTFTATSMIIVPARRFYPAENYHQHALVKLHGDN